MVIGFPCSDPIHADIIFIHGIMGGPFKTWRQQDKKNVGHTDGSDHTGRSTTTCWPKVRRKEGNVLFNDALNTFYLRLYGVRHMVKDHSDSEKGNPLLPHGLLLSISSKGSFICTIPQT